MARRARGVLLGGLAALLCCARGEQQTSAGAGSTTAPAPPSAAANAGASACPATGLWARCSLIARLDASGLAPHVDSSMADESPIPQKGLLVHLYGSDLEAFFYPDSASRRTTSAQMDTAKYVAWDTPLPPLGDHPTLITNANVIAILHSKSDHQRERVFDALTAGAPQPSHP